MFDGNKVVTFLEIAMFGMIRKRVITRDHNQIPTQYKLYGYDALGHCLVEQFLEADQVTQLVRDNPKIEVVDLEKENS